MNSICKIKLNAFEVNFSYIKNKEKKNALVKVVVCKNCEEKLNFKVLIIINIIYYILLIYNK